MKEHPQCKFQVKVISGNDRPEYIFRKSHVTNLKTLFTNFIYEEYPQCMFQIMSIQEICKFYVVTNYF